MSANVLEKNVMEELVAIRGRHGAMPDAEWEATEMSSHKSRRHGNKYYKVVDKADYLSQLCHYVPTKGAAEFLAHAPADMSYLLSLVAAYEEELVRLKALSSESEIV